MRSAIVCAIPAFGHIRPVVAIADALARAGWRVRFVTGKPFEKDVRAVGAEFFALTPEYDRIITPPAKGRASFNHLKEVFLDAVPAQVRVLREFIAAEHTDAVFFDLAIMGARALMTQPRDQRPLIVGCGVFPLVVSSRDVAPFGSGLPPATTEAQRRRYRRQSAFMKNVALRPVHRALDKVTASIGAPPRDGRFMMDMVLDCDVFAEFSVPGFEYPRSDLASHVRFYGPPARSLPAIAPLPEWWARLDDRPIVHVTQGTSFNDQPERLIAPAIRALADQPVQVVVATAGLSVNALGPLPENVFAADWLPYEHLFDRTAVLVTNGGFGTVLQALAHGVPIVAGGGFGDQPETAARIAWSGVGIDLGKRIPTEPAIVEAVQRVLEDPSYREAAGRLAAEVQAAPGADGLVRDVESMLTAQPVAS